MKHRLKRYRPRKRTNLVRGAAGAFTSAATRDLVDALRAVDETIAEGDEIGPLLHARSLVPRYIDDASERTEWYAAIDTLIAEARAVPAAA